MRKSVCGLLMMLALPLAAEPATVNLNEADAETLSASLSGIGQAKAEAIVAWRRDHGPFRQVQDLAQVKGIGPGLLKKNKDRLRLR